MRPNESPLEEQRGDLPALVEAVRARTPARILVERAGLAYRTGTYLELRHDHAAAVDAVRAELEIIRDFGPDFVERWRLFDVQTCAGSKAEYLLRPDLGRKLNERSRMDVQARCPKRADLQVVIGDGLSAAAVRVQAPRLLPLLQEAAVARLWSFGQPFVIHRCRVGALNDVGALLDPAVVVLLIGERPGLATAESLSAYMAYRPSAEHTDAHRNLISNIHDRGVPIKAAADRIVALAAKMRLAQASGTAIKEDFSEQALGRSRLPGGTGSARQAGPAGRERATPTLPASPPRPTGPPN